MRVGGRVARTQRIAGVGTEAVILGPARKPSGAGGLIGHVPSNTATHFHPTPPWPNTLSEHGLFPPSEAGQKAYEEYIKSFQSWQYVYFPLTAGIVDPTKNWYVNVAHAPEVLGVASLAYWNWEPQPTPVLSWEREFPIWRWGGAPKYYLAWSELPPTEYKAAQAEEAGGEAERINSGAPPLGIGPLIPLGVSAGAALGPLNFLNGDHTPTEVEEPFRYLTAIREPAEELARVLIGKTTAEQVALMEAREKSEREEEAEEIVREEEQEKEGGRKRTIEDYEHYEGAAPPLEASWWPYPPFNIRRLYAQERKPVEEIPNCRLTAEELAQIAVNPKTGRRYFSARQNWARRVRLAPFKLPPHGYLVLLAKFALGEFEVGTGPRGMRLSESGGGKITFPDSPELAPLPTGIANCPLSASELQLLAPGGRRLAGSTAAGHVAQGRVRS